MRGSVLITVTWILSLLTIFTLALHRQVSQELFMGQWIRERVVARYVAKAGVERALYDIQTDEFSTFDALNDINNISYCDAGSSIHMQGALSYTTDGVIAENEDPILPLELPLPVTGKSDPVLEEPDSTIIAGKDGEIIYSVGLIGISCPMFLNSCMMSLASF